MLALQPFTGQLFPVFHFDFEYIKSYNLTLQMRDESPANAGPPLLLLYANVTLTVLDANDAPTLTSPRNFTFDENTLLNNSPIGTVW